MEKAWRTENEQGGDPQRQSHSEEQADGGWICFLAHDNSPRVRKALNFASVECFSNSFGFPCTRMVFVSASRKMESSAIMKMLASSCVTTTTVVPRLSRNSRINWSRLRDVMGSNPAEGSSKNRISGSNAIARANPARLRIPPEISAG